MKSNKRLKAKDSFILKGVSKRKKGYSADSAGRLDITLRFQIDKHETQAQNFTLSIPFFLSSQYVYNVYLLLN